MAPTRLPTPRACLILALFASLGWIYVASAKPGSFKLEPIGKLPTPHDQIAVWTRGAGQYGPKKRPARVKQATFKLASLAKRTATLQDLQYKKSRTYRGFYVADVLKRYKRPKGVDLALLHFGNKLVIPYPLSTRGATKKARRLRVFVAVAWKGKKKWRYQFPAVRKKDILFRDHRPIRFKGNKVVVTSRWHPHLSKAVAKAINVWRYAGSLRGIELVDEAAYYKQFAISKKSVARRGLRLFRGSCQFCHGARKVGAGFGRDFTTPVSVHLYINRPAHLRHHIRNRSLFATQEGLMMPSIKNMSKQEAKALWVWIKALWSAKKLKPYQPPQPPPPRRR